MVKKIYIFILLLASLSINAAQQAVTDSLEAAIAACEAATANRNVPYYYCDCYVTATKFQFPLEAEINDTVWYTATVDDLKQGISAYWFSDCSVVMEVYAFCTSKVPTISVTIGRNQMHEIDIATINQKLDEMGKTAEELFGLVTPRIRVYPKDGGSGKVYCYPYNHGVHSTCAEPLPLRPRMTYVCDQAYNAYKMDYSLIPSSGKAFVRWKQDKAKPAEIWFTLDSCNGEEIAHTILTDSLHVYTLDSAMLVQARKGKHPIWMHVQHEEDIVGRVNLYTNPKYTAPAPAIDMTTCLGKTLTANMRTYRSDTAFVDTLWVKKDTLCTMDVALEFTKPEMEYDTIYATAVQIARGYRYQPSGAIIRSFNDTIVDIVAEDECTRWIQVTPIEEIPPTPPVNTSIDNMPMDGKPRKMLINGQIYIVIDDRKYTILGQKYN